MRPFNLPARRRARRFVLQAIYQWQMTHYSVEQIEAQFLQQSEMVSVDTPFLRVLLRGVVSEQSALDAQIQLCLNRPLTEVDQIELAILRMGAYELKHCPDTPYRVVLNEAIELAKVFGAAEGHKYINGVLHCLSVHHSPLPEQTDGAT